MAVLAHALQMVGGWIAPLIIFLVKRESKFVSFHALQVLFFHLVYLCFMVVVGGMFFIAVMGTVFSAAAQNHATGPAALFVFFPFLWIAIMAGWAVTLVFAIVYGIKAGHGEWTEIPVVGKWARQVLHI